MRFTELSETFYTQLAGRDGLPQRVWKNPVHSEFDKIVKDADDHAGMRCLLTATDLFFWQSTSLLHNDFVKQTGIDGVKISLRRDGVLANLESIGAPEEVSWVFAGADVDDLDMEVRREMVEQWLRTNDRLRRAYGNADFPVEWYS